MANNTLQTPEQAFHYRKAICCGTCPAYQDLNKVTELDKEEPTGNCSRLKMPVQCINTCDKHPAWKTLFHGKGGNQ